MSLFSLALNLTHNLWEGDIMIPDTIFESNDTEAVNSVKGKIADYVYNSPVKRSSSGLKAGIGSNLWSGGIVPYAFDSSYSEYKNIMLR